jgi:hypothetical protein
MRSYNSKERRGAIILIAICAIILALCFLLPLILPTNTQSQNREIPLPTSSDNSITNTASVANDDTISRYHKPKKAKSAKRKSAKAKTSKSKPDKPEPTNPLDRNLTN